MRDEMFQKIRQQELVDTSGMSYAQFRGQLAPRWGTVWRHIAMGWLALASLNALIAFASGHMLAVDLLLIPLGALGIGFVIAYLQLFLHEAVHFNIHPSRKANDVLCNVFVSGITGQDVRKYRPIHWQHHKHLGTPMDSEISYFDPLDVRFMLEALLGIRVLKVFAVRKSKCHETPPGDDKSPGALVLICGMLFNAAYLLTLAFFHQWVLCLAWIGGVFVFFPFFGAIRQLLEHRSADAVAGTDFTQTAHGAVHRLFGDGPLASTLGGAGFNRHLLHHWEPAISYTRFGDLERFLMDTSCAAYLREHQTTYNETFKRLFRARG